jgi:hypothetical protein
MVYRYTLFTIEILSCFEIYFRNKVSYFLITKLSLKIIIICEKIMIRTLYTAFVNTNDHQHFPLFPFNKYFINILMTWTCKNKLHYRIDNMEFTRPWTHCIWNSVRRQGNFGLKSYHSIYTKELWLKKLHSIKTKRFHVLVKQSRHDFKQRWRWQTSYIYWYVKFIY